MEEFERQDFDQLNNQLAQAMFGTANADAKKILNGIAAAAQELHRSFKGKSISKDGWDESEGKLHGFYSSLLTTGFEDTLLLGEIKISIDKMLMDTLPREKEKVEEIVQTEPVEEIVDTPIKEKSGDSLKDIFRMNEYDQEEFDKINRDIRHGRF